MISLHAYFIFILVFGAIKNIIEARNDYRFESNESFFFLRKSASKKLDTSGRGCWNFDNREISRRNIGDISADARKSIIGVQKATSVLRNRHTTPLVVASLISALSNVWICPSETNFQLAVFTRFSGRASPTIGRQNSRDIEKEEIGVSDLPTILMRLQYRARFDSARLGSARDAILRRGFPFYGVSTEF